MSECNQKCIKDPSRICGGGFRNSVFDLSGASEEQARDYD